MSLQVGVQPIAGPFEELLGAQKQKPGSAVAWSNTCAIGNPPLLTDYSLLTLLASPARL